VLQRCGGGNYKTSACLWRDSIDRCDVFLRQFVLGFLVKKVRAETTAEHSAHTIALMKVG
jgi:hypothetical protein